MSDEQQPALTAMGEAHIENQAIVYAYGRFDAGQRPWLDFVRFAEVAVAERVGVAGLKGLYNRMLAAGDGVRGGES